MRESAGTSELHHLFSAISLQLLHLSSTSRAVRDGCRGGGGHHKLLNICSKSVFLYVYKVNEYH